MSTDATEIQGDLERRRAAEMSLKRGYPPTAVPGYEPERFLGVGAYGEVWVAREQNTGRRVAIKFYAHRGGLDWSLLSREVEKLAFLFADRYVVQLVGVGWEANPPYYIMEYLEKGSLADRIAGSAAGGRGGGPAAGRGHGTGPRPRQGRAALRPEAGQRLVGPGRAAAVGRFRSVAALDGAGAGVGDDVLHGAGAGGPGGLARRPLGRLRAGGAPVLHVDGRAAAPQRQDGEYFRAARRTWPSGSSTTGRQSKGRRCRRAIGDAGAWTRCWRQSSTAAWRPTRTSGIPTCRRFWTR